MNPLRKQLARVMTDAAQKGMDALHPDSTCAKALNGKKNIHRDLKSDINQICKVISFNDTAKILSYAACIRVVPREKRRAMRAELRSIGSRLFEKAEKRTGKLKIPAPCRNLILGL